MSVATASMPAPTAPSPLGRGGGRAARARRSSVVTVGAANVGIAFLVAVSVRAARSRPPGADGDGVLRRGARAGPRRCRDRASDRCGRVGRRKYASLAMLDVAGLSIGDPPDARRRCDPRDGRRPVGLAHRHGRGRRGRRRRSPTAPSPSDGRWHCAPDRDPRSVRAPRRGRAQFLPQIAVHPRAAVAVCGRRTARRRRSRPPPFGVELARPATLDRRLSS